MRIKTILFEQPIGTFALGVVNAKDIIKISKIDRLRYDEKSFDTSGGPQREASEKRVKEISKYALTPDATFPTPILLAVSEKHYTLDNDCIVLDDDVKSCSIVDGQHRIMGIEKSGIPERFDLPVVFILGATDEQQALLFAVINGKQRQVSSSLIFELYKVTSCRNPYKTVHEVARAMNSDVSSPFYKKLKMLGKKVSGLETLSQGTFASELIKHISSNPDADFAAARENKSPKPHPNCVFNDYFLKNQDDVILKILMNIFGAIKSVFPKEWDDPDSILTKTTGYSGVMQTLPKLVEFGRAGHDLRQNVFAGVFEKLKEIMKREGKNFVNEDLSSNASGQAELRNLILKALKEVS